MKATLNNVLPKFVKTAEFHYYHIFTDNKDEYINIEKESILPHINKASALKMVMEMISKWKESGAENIRVYEVEEWEDYRDGNVELIKEDCIYSIGNYPF